MSQVTSDQGFNQLTHAMGRDMPKKLKATAGARRKMVALMRGKGRQ